MNICEHLASTAKLFPEKEAIVFEGHRFTFSQIDEMSRSVALLLTESGVTPGDRIAIMLPNVPAFVGWYYGALRVGAIAVSISTRLAASEVSFLLGDCAAKIFVALPETSAKLKDVLPDCVVANYAASELGDLCDEKPLKQPAVLANGVDHEPFGTKPFDTKPFDAEPDDPALILYTSGTTGFAKGATLSHANVRSNVHAFNHLCNMQWDDRILLAVPLFHCFGQNALLNSALNVGATLVLQRKFDPAESKQLIADEQITQLYGVPMMFQLFHERCQKADLQSVSYCFSAAATLPIQVGRRWQEKFDLPINEGYGLTETSPFASYNHRIKFTPGSIGTPIDNVEMKIVNTETAATCAPGELGEIAIRGPNVMIGYWNRPEDTAAAIKDGWFHSGDIGRMDESGFFYIVDRVKDMISVGGQKVYPAEVERVLLDHPAVSQAAVVGKPDEVFGEKVIAFVVPARSESSDQATGEIKQYAQDNLANYKVPQQITFVQELPRNPSGKILKTRLREIDLDVIQQSGPLPSDDSDSPVASIPKSTVAPTLRKQLTQSYCASRREVAVNFVQKLVQAITVSDELPDPQTRFLDAGLDSLMIVEMSSQIQVEAGSELEIPATLVFDQPRICDLGDYLAKTLSPIESSATNHAAAKPKSDVNVTSKGFEIEVANMTEQQALEELMKELDV